MNSDVTPFSLTLHLIDQNATEQLAQDVAMTLRAGDLVRLSGDLGAGKSTFARALIRALADDPKLEVPSPTFTLAQSYDLPRFPVTHLDLYRIEEPEELLELALEEMLESGAALVEWPENGEGYLPQGALGMTFCGGESADARKIVLRWPASSAWGERLGRSLKIRQFLDLSGWSGVQRRFLQGDASARSYETIRREGETAVLMNAPAMADGPPVRDGLPYSQLAHLAEDVRPFVAIGVGLRERGFYAPLIFAHDLDEGLLLLEDLGRETIAPEGVVNSERYAAAVDLLADLHACDLPESLPLPGGASYALPRYDVRALLFEAELYPDWYVGRAGETLSATERARFLKLWENVLTPLMEEPTTWVLRDYHSPNLIWRQKASGRDRLGLIDFQDALVGHPAYDVGSLLMDARVDVDQSLRDELLARYCARRKEREAGFDEVRFRQAFVILAAQRVTKILGIFVRLAQRDGKPGYLRHLPRMHEYLDHALQHPVLSDLKLWYEGRQRIRD